MYYLRVAIFERYNIDSKGCFERESYIKNRKHQKYGVLFCFKKKANHT